MYGAIMNVKPILMLALGLVLGLFGSWMILRPTQPGSSSSEELRPVSEEQGEEPRSGLDPVTPRERVVVEERVTREEAIEELFSRPLLEHHEREFLRGWSSLRAAPPGEEAKRLGEEAFRRNVLTLSSRLAEDMAEDANDVDRLETGLAENRGLELLDLLAEDLWIPVEADLAGERLDRCVEVHPAGLVTDGATFAMDGDAFVEPGMTISFGPGIHVLDERRLRGEDGSALPADVTIVGAGKDATLLRIGDISIRGDIERLAFRDLTVDAQNDGMFDARSGKGVLDFLRVRIVRFDAGHGGCYVFAVQGGIMLRAEQCDFLGGYGSYPGGGHLFRHQPKVARFTDCRFELIDVSGIQSSRGHYLFNRCSFLLTGANPLDLQRGGLYFRSCAYEQIPPDTPREELQKKLGDLFYGA